jgi:3-oxosteroid 1-dehydrogenase
MAEVNGMATTDVAPAIVWEFLLEIENWVGEFEGYVDHQVEADGGIVLRMSARIGFMTKRSRLRVVIRDQEPPSRLAFALEGLDDPLTGSGEIACSPTDVGGTRIAYRLSLVAHGLAAPVLDEFLEHAVPSTIGDLAERIARKLSGEPMAEPAAPPSPRRAARRGPVRRSRDWRPAIRGAAAQLTARLGELPLARTRVRGARSGDRFDVVVVGSGGAGLTAALTAHELGASVVVIEKSSQVGGTFAYSTGLTWVPNNHHMRRAGLDDSRAQALEYIRPRTSGRHDEEVLQAFVDRAPEVVDYLERLGVPFEIVPGYPDEQAEAPGGRAHGRYLASPLLPVASALAPYWQERLVRSPTYGALPVSWKEIQEWGGFGSIGTWDWAVIGERLRDDNRAFGMSTAGYLLRAVVQRGIPIRTQSAALELVRERGRVAGVRTSGPGGERTLTAERGVVLATGSYDNNGEMKRALEPHPETISLGATTVDGSGLVMALEKGARFALLGGQLIAPAYHVEGEEEAGRPVHRLLVREPGFPGSIIVNRAGRRFCDEATITDLRHSVAELDPHTRTYPNFPAFLIFDQQWKAKYPLGPLMPGQVPEWLTRGDSAADLGQKLGIDSAAMETTVERFNDGARAGRDQDFLRGESAFSRANGDPDVKPNPCLRPLEPPLYGIELRLGVVGNNAGLVIDRHGRVLHLRGEPMAGLYAAGNAAANQIGGLWYNAGLMNARGLTFAHLGVRHALGAAGNGMA